MMSQAMDRMLDDHVAIRAERGVGDEYQARNGSGVGGTGVEGGSGAKRGIGGAEAGVGEMERREERAARSKLVETIKRHGWALAPRDLALLETVVVNAQPARPSCVMLGISESTGRRRVRVLTAHLKSFEFQFVAQHASKWPQRETLVAQCCVMRGLSITAAAARLKLKPGTVRQVRSRILARIEGARAMMHQFR